MDRDGAGAAGGAKDGGDGAEIVFVLGDDDERRAECGDGHIGGAQRGVGAEGDDDFILPAGVDEDRSRAGGVRRFFDEASGDAFGAVKFLHIGGEGVTTHGADEQRACSGAAGGDGLVGAFAARTCDKGAHDGFAGVRKCGALPREILDEATDDDDLGLHELNLVPAPTLTSCPRDFSRVVSLFIIAGQTRAYVKESTKIRVRPGRRASRGAPT